MGDIDFDDDVTLDLSRLDPDDARLVAERLHDLHGSVTVRESEARRRGKALKIWITAVNAVGKLAAIAESLLRLGAVLKVAGAGLVGFIKAVSVAGPLLLTLFA